ncbi:MAG: hypothetical protein EOP07_07455 [Proteobacteria bacterium]|nr:MAG: hypothetical protein EOP07_07455 [Pseudomonadota bacterium]
MKRKLSLLRVSALGGMIIFSVATAARGQDSSLFPVARTDIGGSLLPSGEGDYEKESIAPIELQQACPQPYGDAWDTTSSTAWNMLELGFQISPDATPTPEIQLYSRYTCARPLERPITDR